MIRIALLITLIATAAFADDNFEIPNKHIAAERIALYSDHVKHLGNTDGFLAPFVKTSDGGFLIVGTRSGQPEGAEYKVGKSIPVVVKLDKAGKVEWEKQYKKSGFKDYEAASAIEIEGAYFIYILSYVHPSIGSVGRFLKIDRAGKILWQTQLRGNGTAGTPFPWTVQHGDGGFLLDGHIYKDKTEQAWKWNGKLDLKGKLVADKIGGKITPTGDPM